MSFAQIMRDIISLKPDVGITSKKQEIDAKVRIAEIVEGNSKNKYKEEHLWQQPMFKQL